jgi:hypothetical protein
MFRTRSFHAWSAAVGVAAAVLIYCADELNAGLIVSAVVLAAATLDVVLALMLDDCGPDVGDKLTASATIDDDDPHLGIGA